MFMRSLRILLLSLLAFGLAGLAFAQSEPTIQQIYATAQAGQVDKARQMTQEVLRSHPKSAKAHFVMAELDASQGKTASAKEELATAESLAPGLPFASAASVQALRSRVNVSATAPERATRPPRGNDAATVREAPASPSFPWGMVLLGAVVIAVVATMLRSRASRRATAMAAPPAAYGAAPGAGDWGRQPGSVPQPGYGPQAGYGQQPAYGQQPGYGPQAAQPGMGSRVMGGLATGAAIGVGALAAQEIGRRMMGEHGQQGLGAVDNTHGSAANSGLANDAGLGSIGGGGGGSGLPQDFGIADPSSWDDGGGSFDGGGDGGGSWDS